MTVMLMLKLRTGRVLEASYIADEEAEAQREKARRPSKLGEPK